eukprot:4931736-Pyramimonas_sp.AAC.1
MRTAWEEAERDRRLPGQPSLQSVLGSQPTAGSSPRAMGPAAQEYPWVQQLPQGLRDQYLPRGALPRP